MYRFPAWLTRTSSRRPVAVLALVALTTVALASFIPQGELSNDSTAFSPDSDEVAALNEVRDRFDDTSTSTLQIVVQGDDVVSPDGVTTAQTIVTAAEDRFGDALATGGGPPIVTFADPAISAAAEQGVDLATADDATVDGLQVDGLASFDPGRADLAATLSAGEDTTTADAGLVVIQLDRSAFADEEARVHHHEPRLAPRDGADRALRAGDAARHHADLPPPGADRR